MTTTTCPSAIPCIGAFAALDGNKHNPTGWIRPITAAAYEALRPYRDDYPYRVQMVDGNRQMHFARREFDECIEALEAAGVNPFFVSVTP